MWPIWSRRLWPLPPCWEVGGVDKKLTYKQIEEAGKGCGAKQTVGSGCFGCPLQGERRCVNRLFDALAEENKRLREERRWIPTSERNPDRELEEEPKGEDGKPLLGGYECIAQIEGAKRPTALWYCDLDGERVWTDETGENLYRVTHWKPMPKGPEAE